MLEPWVPFLLEAVGLAPGNRVIDIACGTGFVTRQAARALGESGKTVGVDINEGMLELAKISTDSTEPFTIDWQKGDVGSLPFEDASFNVALCQQGLQFFDDKNAALCEVRRILVPGGKIGLSVWGSLDENPYFSAITEAARRHIGKEAADGLNNPHTLANPADVADLLATAGFQNIIIKKTETYMSTPPVRAFLPAHLSAMPVGDMLSKLPEQKQSAMLEDVFEMLKPYTEADGLQVPGVVYIATAFNEQQCPNV